jgi:hemolysin D
MEGGEPVLKDMPDIDADRVVAERRLLDSQWREYKNTLERTAPIMRNRSDVFKTLFEKEVVSEQQFREQEKTAIEQEGQLAAQSEKVRQIQASLDEATKQKASLIAETRRTILDGQREADQKVTTNYQEFVKAKQRH